MEFILYLPILFFSVIVHEYAHGYTAYRYGDDTAYLLGRLTFNPIAHVDIVGTIIVPIICYVSHIPMFGWAKPVPINYYRLRNPKADMAKVALAGPFANLFLVAIAAGLLKLMAVTGSSFSGIAGAGILGASLMYAVMINLLLAIFNLIPVPPLDGSRVLAWLLPPRLSDRYMQLERYGMYIVIALIVTGLFSKIVLPLFRVALNIVFSFIGVSNGQF